MGCCTSKKTGLEDRRRIIDHFMPPGAPLQPRYTYRLEKIDEAEMEMIRTRCYAEAGALGGDIGSEDGQTVTVKHSDDLLGDGDHVEDRVQAARDSLVQAVGQVLLRRLGSFDCPVVGEDRFVLVETPIGTGAAQYGTEEILLDEEEMVRQIEQQAAEGRLFVSNTFGLASFELPSRRAPPPSSSDPISLEPLAVDSGVDFEEVLAFARDKALQGWRFRGALRARPQVQDYVLSYALYADVVVTPFTHLIFSPDAAAQSTQVELVELRGTSSVITGALVRIVRAWARRGWRLSCVLYNLVTTYDKVRSDPPEGAGAGEAELADVYFTDEDVGGEGALGLYLHTAAYFERRMPPSEEGQMQAKLALQQRRKDQERHAQAPHHSHSSGGGGGHHSHSSASESSAASTRPTVRRHPLD